MKKIMLIAALALMAGMSGCVNKADIDEEIASSAPLVHQA